MFMQAGFALVETGLCRAKNSSHTMAMNFMIYRWACSGFTLCGFAFMFGGSCDRTMGNYAGLNDEFTVTLFGKPFAARHESFLLQGAVTTRRPSRSSFSNGVHGHDRDDPTGARPSLAVLCVHDLRLCIGTFMYPCSAIGSGVAAGSRSSARTSASVTATWISPARRWWHMQGGDD